MKQSIVAKNAKQIINERGLKQKAVAVKCGYESSKVFGYLLNGQKLMRTEDIIRLSKGLEVDYNELFKNA